MSTIWTVRVKSFLWTAGVGALGALLTYFSSPEFQILLEENTGGTMWGAVILVLFPQIILHVRNMIAASKVKLGSKHATEVTYL